MPISPTEAADAMRAIAADDDTEGAHRNADDLMASILTSLGYSEAVEEWNEMPKWYS